jgi:uncharacterized protein YjlB
VVLDFYKRRSIKAMSNIEPEVYYIPTTKYVPNNKLPVVIYRKVFTGPYDEDGVTEYLERHNWVKGVSIHIQHNWRTRGVLTEL